MSVRRKRIFNREFKLQIVRALITGEQRISQLCREHDLSETLVRNWKERYEREGEDAWRDQRPDPSDPSDPHSPERVAQLEAALGRAHLEIELLRRAVKKGGSRPGSGGK